MKMTLHTNSLVCPPDSKGRGGGGFKFIKQAKPRSPLLIRWYMVWVALSEHRPAAKRPSSLSSAAGNLVLCFGSFNHFDRALEPPGWGCEFRTGPRCS